MSSRTHLLCSVTLATFALLTTAGCQRSGMRFTSYRDPYFPERFTLDFGEGVYRVAPGGDLYAVGHTVRVSKPDAPVIGAAGVDSDHYLQVHVYWKPRPGKTFAESTMSDAALTYTVATDQGSLTYVGTGFAYPQRTRSGMEFRIESGRLRLDTRTGELTDVFGDTRIEGILRAKANPAATLDLAREAQIAAQAPASANPG